MQEIETPEGETVYVADDDWLRGMEGPFLAAYLTADRTDRWGWFCSNCESLDNAMDPMGRIKCNNCANYRKPDQWDAAHE